MKQQRRPAATALGLIALVSPLLYRASAVHADEADAKLDLDALIGEAVASHPDVSSAKELAASLDEVPGRVGSLPDPMFMVSAQNLRTDEFAFDGHPMTGLVVGLSQTFPFPGKLGRRERAAGARVTVAERGVDLVSTNIELRVRLAYWELHYAERALAIATENEKVINTLTDVVHARYGVGQGAQQDALQAQVAHSRLRARVLKQREAVVSARRTLLGAVGRDPDGTAGQTAAPPKRRALLARTQLNERAIKHNPALALQDGRLLAADRAVEEARYDRWPDFGLAAGYRVRWAAMGDASDGADMVSLTLSVSLPIWMGKKQSARWREERKKLSSVRSDRASVALEVRTRVLRLFDAIERIDKQLQLYETEILKEIDQALDASIADYQVGKVSFVSVLDNWRQTLDAQLEYERLLVDRQSRVSELRALTGGDVEEP